MKLRTRAIMLSLGLAALSGCSLDANAPSTSAQESPDVASVQEAISVRDGRLVFADNTAYETTISKLALGEELLADWESQFAGFTSMRAAYERLAETDAGNLSADELEARFGRILEVRGEGEDREASILVEDPALATVVNDEGVLQIGQDLYKVTYDRLYRVAAESPRVRELRALSGALAGDKLSGIEASSVSRHTQDLFDRVDTCDSTYSSGKKRLKGEIYTQAVGSLYSSAGARSKHQRKRLGIWWRNQTQKLRLEVNGTYTQYFNGIPQPPTQVNSDTGWQGDDGREAYKFDFCANVSCYFEINQMVATHSAVCDDGATRTCQTHVN